MQRLSVFSGGWTLEAAEAVCSSEGLEAVEVLDILNSLEKKSMVVVDTLSGEQARYHMLETIRQYAAEKLGNLKLVADTNLATTLHDCHLAFFLALSREFGPRLHTSQITETLQLLDLETDNLRAAITWGLSKNNPQGAEHVLGILTALDYFWAMRALYWETFPRFLRALEQLPNESNFSVELKAWGFYILSRLQVDFNIGTETLEYLNQSVLLFRQAGHQSGLAMALALRSFIIFRQIYFFPPDPAFCEAYALHDKRESLAIFNDLLLVEKSNIQREVAWVNCWIGGGAVYHGNFAEGKEFGLKGQIRFEQLGDWIGELYGWVVWLYASLNDKGGPELLHSVDHAMELARRIDHKWYQSHFYLIKARVYYSLGAYPEFEANTNECFVLSQQVGSIREQNNLSVMLGNYYTDQQNYAKALFYLGQALNQLYREERYKDLYLTLQTLSIYAKLAVEIQQFQLAVQLLGFIAFRLEGYSKKYGGFNLTRFEQSREKVAKVLDEEKYQANWVQGQKMTMEQAVACALEIR